MDRAAIEAALRAYFEAHGEEFACVYLFGSVARDTARPDSDVDIAVLRRRSAAREGTFESLPLDLEGELEHVLGRRVDVVDLRMAAPDLVHRILRDGRLVHEADSSARIAFEVRERNEWFDVRPYLDRYRRIGDAR